MHRNYADIHNSAQWNGALLISTEDDLGRSFLFSHHSCATT